MILWNTPWSCGIFLDPVGYSLILWDIPWSCGIFLDPVGYSLILWDTPWSCGIPLDPVGYSLILWDIPWSCAILRDPVGYSVILRDTGSICCAAFHRHQIVEMASWNDRFLQHSAVTNLLTPAHYWRIFAAITGASWNGYESLLVLLELTPGSHVLSSCYPRQPVTVLLLSGLQTSSIIWWLECLDVLNWLARRTIAKT